MKYFWEYLKLVRLHNLLLVVGSVLLGGWRESKDLLDPRLLLAAGSAVLLAAFGYAHNDYCDQEVDRFHKSHRPLAKGKIREKSVLILSAIMAMAGAAVPLWINAYN